MNVQSPEDFVAGRSGSRIPGPTGWLLRVVRPLLGNLRLPTALVPVFLLASLPVLLPSSLRGQPTFTVEGRVVEKNAAVGIPAVRVELEGPGRADVGTTAGDGRFRFDNVRRGGYTLRVLGGGYRPRLQYVYVDEDVALILPLGPAPRMEGRTRGSRKVGESRSGVAGAGVLRGVVRAGEWGLPFRAAEVLTDRGLAARTGEHGAFAVRGLPRGSSVLVSVRAFGYLPLDTVVVVDGSERHDFQIWRDPTVQRRIDREVEALEARAALRPGPVRTLGREALLASHRATLAEMIRDHHGETLRRVRCVVLDGDPGHSPDVLSRLAPGDLERVELLVDSAGSADTVVRVFSRDFIRDLVGGGVEAETPDLAYVEGVADVGSGRPCGGPVEDVPD